MIGLTNMISLMNATGQSKALFMNQWSLQSQLGTADANLKMGGTNDLEAAKQILNSTYQNVNPLDG